MARAIAKTMALPRRLPLGRQRQSLHRPRRRAKEGQRADAGVSIEITAAPEAEGHRLDISTLAKLRLAAIFGHLHAAARTEPLAPGIRRTSPSPVWLPLKAGNRLHIVQLCQMRLHGFAFNVTMVHAA